MIAEIRKTESKLDWRGNDWRGNNFMHLLETEEKLTTSMERMLKFIPHVPYYHVSYEKLLTSDFEKNLWFLMPFMNSKSFRGDPGVLLQMHSTTCESHINDYPE